ncbi:hypothetical protein N7466_009759 [Penicillium verhagenii]|uniref:uncharacterized protein n=1 Tax=Penicillium verhagenii TaxID=1562060 RepID=UPI002545A1AC|nr:uncharacterized protein N7466_009759 [Penicillium verhagenii]KAJ5921433.1 hypothetical protein N7466_009759 [Penicillium verhagenii]
MSYSVVLGFVKEDGRIARGHRSLSLGEEAHFWKEIWIMGYGTAYSQTWSLWKQRTKESLVGWRNSSWPELGWFTVAGGEGER